MKFDEWWAEYRAFILARIEDWSPKQMMRTAYDSALPKWQPFETAPKDGTQYLLSMGGRLIICRWCTKIDALVYDGKVIEPARPWFWMPLPAAPQGDEK